MRLLIIALIGFGVPAGLSADVDYNRDVRPVLADNCYRCHGPDAAERKAGVQLDIQEAAFAPVKSGGRAIVPGDIENSLLVHRITASDPGDLMPPPESGKSLTAEQIDILRRWIAEGAQWSKHWSFVTPKRPSVPDVASASWARSPVDRFIQARLDHEGMKPSREADPITLLRRLHFDLTGLPPSADEVRGFLDHISPGAFERHVDQLLESPHFGERMAIFWLDLVRFADSRGYHSDNDRAVSPYRDYVLRSLNRNKPFDEFTIEQLAGDLLETPTLEQRVASAYNKLLQTTEEGGAQPKEYEAKSVADRVRNVSVVWMGATLGCAECHDHKFDPYGTRDFYSLGAFFADVQEVAVADRDPGIPVPEDHEAEELARLSIDIERLRARVTTSTPELEAAQLEWERGASGATFGTWNLAGPFPSLDERVAYEHKFGPEKELEEYKSVKLDGEYETKDGSVRWKKREDLVDGKLHQIPTAAFAAYVHRTIEVDGDGTIALRIGTDGGVRIWSNGEKVYEKVRPVDAERERKVIDVPLKKGVNHLVIKIAKGAAGSRFFFEHVRGDWVPESILALVNKPSDQRTPEERKDLAAYYRSVAPVLDEPRAKLAASETRHKALLDGARRCLVTVSGPPRTVRVLPRGNWLDGSGEVVSPAIPAYFGALETGDRRPTRLDLARWLVSKKNPLGARVLVNRLWKLFFGMGISNQLEDLGAMGEPPVHAALLDWLAVELAESGWNLKHMVRLLVTSATYRQSSVATADARGKDPYNRLVSRQSTWRFDAEVVRDNALAISGLLTYTVGGPSVRPYQPPGYWANLNFPVRKWEAQPAPDCYRRGIYTWWQRSFMHPALMAFDAPSREECMAERPRSNIPQQALVLLNDPTYVEAARVLAERIVVEGGASSVERLRWVFRNTLSREPDLDELTTLAALYEKQRASYGAEPESARQLTSIGHSVPPSALDVVELAAWTSVSRAILNLHEIVTRN